MADRRHHRQVAVSQAGNRVVSRAASLVVNRVANPEGSRAVNRQAVNRAASQVEDRRVAAKCLEAALRVDLTDRVVAPVALATVLVK